MIRLQGKVVLAAAADAVCRFLADVANEPSWQNGIVHVQLVEGKAGQVGAKYERVQVVGGRNIKTVNELVEMSLGKRVVFQAKGKVIEYRLEHSLSAKGKSVELETKLEGEMLGFASMFEGMAADELKEALPGDLERLRARLEKA
jgi:hypothetical protein